MKEGETKKREGERAKRKGERYRKRGIEESKGRERVSDGERERKRDGGT